MAVKTTRFDGIEKKVHVSQPKGDADFEESVGLRIDGAPIPGDAIENHINQVVPEETSRFFCSMVSCCKSTKTC